LKWSKALQDIESGHLLATSNIAKIITASKELVKNLGSPVALDGASYTKLW
jgi:hypothetical protein